MMDNFLKDHVKMLRLMFERCRQLQIYINLKKYILCTPFGTLLGHIVCKYGMLVDPSWYYAIRQFDFIYMLMQYLVFHFDPSLCNLRRENRTIQFFLSTTNWPRLSATT
jgi:hypothetical protein